MSVAPLARPAADPPLASGVRAGRAAAGIPLPWPQAGLIAGAVLLALALRLAETDAGQAHVALFWLGMALGLVPLAHRMCALATPRGERLALLAALAIFDSLPKLLRSPDHLLFYDELAHWRQAVATLQTGRLFLPNPLVPILQAFPGLHALTASLCDLTGLSPFQVAIGLLFALHLCALLGVFALGEAILGSARQAAIAALIYSLNPGFLYFDAMYSYQSLALVFFIWTMLALARMQTAADRAGRRGWLLLAMILAAACVITHHASSYFLALVVGLLLAIVNLMRRCGAASGCGVRALALFALCLLGGEVWWAIAEAGMVTSYLGPFARALGLGALGLFQPHAHQRVLFAASIAPAWERAVAFLAPVLCGVGALAALAMARRRRGRDTPMAWALFLLGALYYLSLPLVLTPGGQEAARRSWSFTSIGVALWLAPLCVAIGELAGRSGPIGKATIGAGATAALCILLIGNTAGNVNPVYRFPGAPIYGSDVRTLTADTLDASAWFRATQGGDQTVIADRAMGMAFASFGDAWTSLGWSGLPTWQFYLSDQGPSAALLSLLARDRYRYLVTDDRIARSLPLIGYYVSRDEPGAGAHTRPPPQAAIDRYAWLPWAIAIYQGGGITIYRLDYAARDLSWRPASRSTVLGGPVAQQLFPAVPEPGEDHGLPRPNAGSTVRMIGR